MKVLGRLLFVVFVAGNFASASASAAVAQDAGVVKLVVGLLNNPDPDVRALAYEQVRSSVPGAASTKKFAELLPGLPGAAQTGLLQALADRGDKAAAPAVRSLLASSQNGPVRVAAIKAIGSLGEATDLDLLVKLTSASSAAEQAAAQRSLIVLSGDDASAAMASEIGTATPSVRVMLLQVLATRRARNTIPAIVEAALGDLPDVRRAAMTALSQLAGPEHIPRMLRAVLKAKAGREREAAEKAVMAACHRFGQLEQ